MEEATVKLTELVRQPWAILPAALDNIVRECAFHRAQAKADHALLKDAYFSHRADRLRTVAGPTGYYKKMLDQAAVEQAAYVVVDGVAVLMITGPVTKNYELITWMMDGTSTAAIAAGFKAALADQRVKSIMLYVDSPGGHVDGTQELANLIYASRGAKPIIAFSDGGVYSAAMYIAAAADRLLISGDMAGVGSIGVIATHVDISKTEEAIGVKVTEIYAGKYKGVGSPHRPLSDADKAIYQAEIDQMYSIFVNDIARYRGVTVDDVLSRMADGLTFLGNQGIEAGLVDGVSTMDALLADMAAGVAVESTVAAVSVAQATIKEKDIQAMDIKELEAKHPELFAAAVAQGKAQAMDEGLKKGAEAERARIAEISAIVIPGHEAAAKAAIESGMSVGAFAVAQSRTEKEVAVAALKAQEAEAPKVQTSTEPPAAGVAASSATPEEKEKAAWDKDETLRGEFKGDYAAYQAYNRAVNSGRVKVKGGEV